MKKDTLTTDLDRKLTELLKLGYTVTREGMREDASIGLFIGKAWCEAAGMPDLSFRMRCTVHDGRKPVPDLVEKVLAAHRKFEKDMRAVGNYLTIDGRHV